MTETTIPLIKTITVIANSAGRAVAELSPATHEKWTVKSTVVTTQSPTGGVDLVSSFRLYRGVEERGSMIDSTNNGKDNITDTEYVMAPGNRVLGVWSGMTAGNRATMRVEGDLIMKGRRMY